MMNMKKDRIISIIIHNLLSFGIPLILVYIFDNLWLLLLILLFYEIPDKD